MTKPLRTAFCHCEISGDVLKRDHPHERRSANSFANDLGLGRGVVLSRAVFSLRSIETKPRDCWIVLVLLAGSFQRCALAATASDVAVFGALACETGRQFRCTRLPVCFLLAGEAQSATVCAQQQFWRLECVVV